MAVSADSLVVVGHQESVLGLICVVLDVADGGFRYALSATNTDNRTSYHSAIEYKDVSAGKLYTLRYSYDSNATSGGVDIVITDDMGTDDSNISL